jgi:hypothetical protein
MIQFTTTILKMGQQGEKSGWTYINVPQDLALQLKPGNKKSFRVKGKLDAHAIKAVAILPMGDGNFILPLNAAMRKAIGKKQGAMLQVPARRARSTGAFFKRAAAFAPQLLYQMGGRCKGRNGPCQTHCHGH